MITLEKLLSELKAESLNEIVAGGHTKKKHKKGKKGKHGHGGGTSGTHTGMTSMSMTTDMTMSDSWS